MTAPTVIKNSRTAELAEQLIGAAQVFEKAARDLKARAKQIRADGLTQYDQEPVAVVREWEQIRIKAVAIDAMREMGASVDYLSAVEYPK